MSTKKNNNNQQTQSSKATMSQDALFWIIGGVVAVLLIVLAVIGIKREQSGTVAENGTAATEQTQLTSDDNKGETNPTKGNNAANGETNPANNTETLKVYEEIPEGHPVVTVEMENGKKFKIELYPEYAPQTVANFVALAESGFYNGVGFHRVVEGFMAQGGDPEGTGMGGSGMNIKGEFAMNGFAQNTLKHERGVISMARSQMPDSASSQFFICYDDATFLDGQYAAFGKVIEGMEVVDGFLEVERTMNEMGEEANPTQPIIMKSVTVEK